MVSQEGANSEQLARLFGSEESKGAQMVIADDIFNVADDCGVECAKNIIDARVDVYPTKQWIANKVFNKTFLIIYYSVFDISGM